MKTGDLSVTTADRTSSYGEEVHADTQSLRFTEAMTLPCFSEKNIR